ncbi:hypothetical protein C0991_010379, partial [Blastosporella zonata]
MAKSTAKNKHLVVHSDNKASDNDQPAKKVPKCAVKELMKIAESNKENFEKAKLEITKLKKKMLKLQSQKADEEEDDKSDINEDLESEDKEDLPFSSSNDCLEKLGDMDGLQYEFTDHMLCILKHCGSRICGKLLTATRSKVRTVFGFGWDKPTYIKTNAAKATALHNNNTFHFKNPEAEQGFYKNSIILSVLTATIFKDKHATGVLFREMFNPILLYTLSLVLTLVGFCISEWKTGKFEQGIFLEKLFKDTYKVHFADLKKWYYMSPKSQQSIARNSTSVF